LRVSLDTGEPLLKLFGPDMGSPLPGLLTGMILTSEGGPVYLRRRPGAVGSGDFTGVPQSWAAFY
jgi:hypothetical protein